MGPDGKNILHRNVLIMRKLSLCLGLMIILKMKYYFETQNNWEILNLKNSMKEVNVDNAWEKLKNRIEKDNERDNKY
ncbi:MAG: hypothetical protein MZV63_42130 [Marinilabiliales bacterium]|nr:hypothetical protein [Marinilabiliales bacterium]